jgi:hypothetical protein
MQRTGALSALAIAVAWTSQATGEEHLLVNVFPGSRH